MGLMLNALPDRDAQFRSLQQELFARNRQLEDSERALREERQKNAALESGLANLRQVLGPLYGGLRLIFGEMDAMGVGSSSASSVDPRVQAAWDNWKQKLGGTAARFIDALLLHGEMTQTQLRIAVGCAKGTVPGVVCNLNKAGLLNKNGGKISLKQL